MIFFKHLYLPIIIALCLIIFSFFKSRVKHYNIIITKIKIPKTKFSYWFWINILLLFIAALGPYKIDKKYSGHDEGVSIVLALDVSGSMGFEENGETRFDIARRSATNFVKKRIHDHLGLVLFGRVALTRSPLTYDKDFIIKTINDYQLGEINPNGTVLFQALLTSINRLKDSNAKSKVIILLTDGLPDSDGVSIENVIESANKYNIKIYTIGVGLNTNNSPVYYHETIESAKKLLDYISQKTDGSFFNAQKAQDLDAIYSLIDSLECSKNDLDFPVKKIDLDWIFALFVLLSEFLRRLCCYIGVLV